MGKLQLDTVDGRIILGHSRQDNCIRTQWLRQISYDTVDETFMLHNRQLIYIMTQ